MNNQAGLLWGKRIADRCLGLAAEAVGGACCWTAGAALTGDSPLGQSETVAGPIARSGPGSQRVRRLGVLAQLRADAGDRALGAGDALHDEPDLRPDHDLEVRPRTRVPGGAVVGGDVCH